jgi:hypothetical protein
MRRRAEMLRDRLIDALRRVTGMDARREASMGSAQQMIDSDLISPISKQWRIWENARCIVASRSQSLMPGFSNASRQSAAQGWPVVVRMSGGSAVAHRPGILNISSLSCLPLADSSWVTEGYRRFLGMLVDSLGVLGIEADHGNSPGSYCDGRFNLRVDGRKLAGTAAYSGAREGQRFCMFHASVTVTGSCIEDVRAVMQFERALGTPCTYQPGAHVSLEEYFSSKLPNRSWPRSSELRYEFIEESHTGECI